MTFKIDQKQIVVISTIIGSIFFILIGILFPSVDYKNYHGRSGIGTDRIEVFNLILAIPSFLIGFGISYLLLTIKKK